MVRICSILCAADRYTKKHLLGKIDCRNGFDERYCQELEMNECNPESERRCSDGQCVDDPHNSKKLAEICSEAFFHATEFFFGCYQHYKMHCEIQRCPPLYFSCGDGYCYDGPSLSKRQCHTQRDQHHLHLSFCSPM